MKWTVLGFTLVLNLLLNSLAAAVMGVNLKTKLWQSSVIFYLCFIHVTIIIIIMWPLLAISKTLIALCRYWDFLRRAKLIN